MSERVDWVDVAKGICIVMVVMMHSTLGVEKAAGATGWMGYVGGIRAALPHAGLLPDRRPLPREPHRRAVAALSRPQGAAFRLFLRALADHPVRLQGAGHRRRARLGRACARISHAPSSSPGARSGSSTTWRSSCVVTRLLKSVPWLHRLARRRGARDRADPHRLDADRRIRQPLRLLLLRLHLRPLRLRASPTRSRADRATGADRTGALGDAERPPRLQRLRRPAASSAWRSGFAGALAIVAGATLIARTPRRVGPFRWLGEHSIVVYLAFFLPMAVSRTVLLKTGLVTDVGTISLLVTLAGIVGPVVLYAFIQWTRLRQIPVRAAGLGAHRRALPAAARGDGAGGVE